MGMAPGAEQIKSVGVVGLGYWGPKLARCFHQLGVLGLIVDTDPAKLVKASEELPGIPLHPGFVNLDDMKTLANLDAVAIATPPETHYALAREALEHGLHTFVEKPLATSFQEARELEDLAEKEGLRLMVGHIYLHCPGLLAIPCDPGSKEVFIQFLNPRGHPGGSNRDIKWAALPHAASIVLHLIPSSPDAIQGRRYEHGLRAVLTYWDGSRACLQVGDFTGMRRRQVEVRAGNTRYQFDADNPLCRRREPISSRLEWVTVEQKEPLLLECEAFLKGTVGPFTEVPGSQVVRLVEQIWKEVKPG